MLFPNLVPYAKWSSVSIYSPDLHLVPLEELAAPLIRDNLAAQVEFARAVTAHDPDSAWASISANHLPPSGSSIFHPHLQGSANPVPTTAQRLFAELSRDAVREYVELERSAGDRFVASGEHVVWLTSFAPAGLAEVRAFAMDASSLGALGEPAVGELTAGLSRILHVYAELGFQSFNLALHGGASSSDDTAVILRIVARAYFGALQRSDVMWSERLHAEAATDLWPERLAELARRAPATSV